MQALRDEIGSPKPIWVKASPMKLTSQVIETGGMVTKLARDDWRRVVHAVKVGAAIVLVSLLYYSEAVVDGFGAAAMWAVLTVVVIFEFYVGATLGKGLNRVVATTFAGFLGVGAHSLASLFGDQAESLILAIFVFIVAATVTFLRFFPKLKARYDYGLMITILTFSLVCVSGYQDDEIIDEAWSRALAIIIGSSTTVVICILVCPVWAGADLHNLVADNLAKLANSIQGFGADYFEHPGEVINDERKEFMRGFECVLKSKSSEDSLVNYAKWEPPHGRFKYTHPWEEYRKIGELSRECARTIQSLTRFLHSDYQAPKEVKSKIEDACTEVSVESGKALRDLSMAMKKNTSDTAMVHVANAQVAAKRLNALLQTGLWTDHLISQAVPAAAVASLLLDAVSSTVKIAQAIKELPKLTGQGAVSDLQEVVVVVEEASLPEASIIEPHTVPSV